MVDFEAIGTAISQKQLRHINGRREYRGGGVMDSVSDAQAVLDAYHAGKVTILGRHPQAYPVVRYEGIIGTDINIRYGVSQPTNVFGLKGTVSPSVVPMNPKWKP